MSSLLWRDASKSELARLAAKANDKSKFAEDELERLLGEGRVQTARSAISQQGYFGFVPASNSLVPAHSAVLARFVKWLDVRDKVGSGKGFQKNTIIYVDIMPGDENDKYLKAGLTAAQREELEDKQETGTMLVGKGYQTQYKYRPDSGPCTSVMMRRSAVGRWLQAPEAKPTVKPTAARVAARTFATTNYKMKNQLRCLDILPSVAADLRKGWAEQIAKQRPDTNIDVAGIASGEVDPVVGAGGGKVAAAAAIAFQRADPVLRELHTVKGNKAATNALWRLFRVGGDKAAVADLLSKHGFKRAATARRNAAAAAAAAAATPDARKRRAEAQAAVVAAAASPAKKQKG